MEKEKEISGLNSLNEEIKRLEQKTEETEQKLKKSVDYARENFLEMARYSFLPTCQRRQKEEKEDFRRFVNNGIAVSTIEKISGYIGSIAIKGIERIVLRFFRRKKKK